ncbi:Fe2+-enterobactin ABC transporter substrate-binding protein [Rhodococcus wratislaviensis]|uniref:Putative iron-siderophore binding protein n=1 Tax=Rhodococcus wratislaviensis NBRC 100605 TaxID=1219028 RepID=X0QB01_RHOWR|nr:Fe2+-enterobactin ABC transporter substrate-binding protein [Rhodococcus wratislaviensis]GAF48782.1 putative iron-siderophore binding protein [Rhodococcus wratislaviensis NBRC 100605]
MKLRRSLAAVAVLAVGIGAAACSSDPDSDAATAGTPAASDQSWPRTVTDETGSITIDQKPERIVSTSVTLTGSLLALDAPLIGTGAQRASDVTDEHGLFTQWAAIAAERGVETLYQGAPNVEKITAADPDLIFVSATGGDSALDQVDTLKQIAPVVVLRYDDKSWQDLSGQIAAAIGAEEQADALVAKFDRQLDDAKSALGSKVAAANPVNVLAYNSPEESRIFTAESAQGILLERLGFSLAELPSDLTAADKGIMAGRKDVVPAGQENLPRAVPGNTTFIVIGEAADADRFLADPTLQQTPSAEKKQVIGLGKDSFRLDYYSASNLIDRVTNAVR